MTSLPPQHRRFGTALPILPAGACAVLALLSWAGVADAQGNAARRADQRFTSYAFAHEFGSGVYDFNGRTLQVYGLPFGWTFLEHGEQHPGLRLRLPVTLGFLDFRAADVIEIGLPDQVDSVSFVPGIEAEFVMAGHWRVLPYVQVGKSLANESDVETDLFGTGVRAEREFTAGRFDGLYAGEGIFSQVRYRGDSLPDDDFLRIRNGVELTRATGRALGGNSIAYGVFAAVDAFVDPPTGPKTGIDVPRTQLEMGVVFGTRPVVRIWKVPLPRVGLSYRFAGDLSAVRIVLGAPF
jgi:hypothetical protein